jgi:hypothetical protein
MQGPEFKPWYFQKKKKKTKEVKGGKEARMHIAQLSRSSKIAK